MYHDSRRSPLHISVVSVTLEESSTSKLIPQLRSCHWHSLAQLQQWQQQHMVISQLIHPAYARWKQIPHTMVFLLLCLLSIQVSLPSRWQLNLQTRREICLSVSETGVESEASWCLRPAMPCRHLADNSTNSFSKRSNKATEFVPHCLHIAQSQ